MKLFFILLLVSVVAVLGCTPQEANTSDLSPDTLDTGGVLVKTSLTSDYAQGEWITDYDLALKYASELERPVLINFTGSDWCIWCKKLMSEVFEKKAFMEYAKDNLVLLKIDFPQKKKLPPTEQAANQKLAEKYDIQGFPTIVLLSPEGQELNRTGYQEGGSTKYVGHLQMLLAE